MTGAPPTVELVDPSTLLTDVNIRTAANVDKDFLASVTELGVLVPVVAVRTADGALRVRYGHRRTLAAIEAKLATVPVMVTSEDEADDAARIVAQWHENEHRAGLSTADKVAAVEQLTLLGLSPTQIAKRTRSSKAEVVHAIATAGSALATAASSRYDFLTLDQAAAVAEFDDAPDVVKALVAAAKIGDGEFRHVLQRARDDRAEAIRTDALRGELADAGVRITDRPAHTDQTIKVLTDLTDDNGTSIQPATHLSCAGHAAYIQRGWDGVSAVYVCTQWAEAGHRDRYRAEPAASSEPTDGTARAERRAVIAYNKAWKSAESVRREWLVTFLTRKTAPKGALGFALAALTSGDVLLGNTFSRSHALALELLGSNPATENVTDSRVVVQLLSFVLAGYESNTSIATWRHPSDTARRYLQFLQANGYTLSAVEKLVATQATTARDTGVDADAPRQDPADAA